MAAPDQATAARSGARLLRSEAGRDLEQLVEIEPRLLDPPALIPGALLRGQLTPRVPAVVTRRRRPVLTVDAHVAGAERERGAALADELMGALDMGV
jgi:hypothetical protein